MSNPENRSIGESPTPPEGEASDLAVPADSEPQLGDSPKGAAGPIAEAGKFSGVPVRARPRPWTEPDLELVTWVSNKSRGPLRLLRNKLFVAFVLIPFTLSAIYFGLIASDVYISESRFVVRTPQRMQQPSVIGALLQGSSFTRAQDDAFTVHDYIQSRDALLELDRQHRLKAVFTKPEIDLFNRFPGPLASDNFESFFKYYADHVSVEFDAASSITTLRVRSFQPDTSLAINASLLALSERLVNKINDRGRKDMIQYAAAEVAEAETKAKGAALAVATYRNQRAVFDPERQSALQLQQVSKLQDDLIATKLQLAQISSLSPQNPQIGALQKRVAGLEANMAAEMAKVAGGGANTFSNKAADYERLQLERTFAERQVASALTSLENARNEARRQQLYLERVVQPNLPDYALEPRRLRNVLATLLLGLIGWGIASMLLSGVKEHQA
ncbi:MAG: hypothetical protein ABI564_15580 [Ideonella sp.]